MKKMLVTGATGRLGSAILECLLQRCAPANIVALARDHDKAQVLVSKGIEVRYGDYSDYDTLVSAFEGVDRIYMVSAVAFTDRTAQHKNVIDAARFAGVRHVIYTSIQRTSDHLCPIDGVTDSDIATESMLENSGMSFTIVRHPLYANDLPMFIGAQAAHEGFSCPAGDGRIALACYQELAEAGAILLSQDCDENRRYLLNSGQTWSFSDIADALSGLTGKPIAYEPISSPAFILARESEGWPAHVALFLSGWYAAIKAGAFEETGTALEALLGRKPKQLESLLKDAFGL
ncbi:SDR family oxidoreductase [Pseudomonas abietaniphila]|uniref:SDR family oxidoreductase n=1 Tax=Pseudomonas abietaniphila TaxID=89065 RepID=UPI003217456F